MLQVSSHNFRSYLIADPGGVIKPKRDHLPTDIGLLPMLQGLAEDQSVRLFYSTEGQVETLSGGSHLVHPGRIRAIDLPYPIPDLSQPTFNNLEWPGSQGLAFVLPPLANWNAILDGGNPDDPPHGKGESFQGFAADGNRVFVSGIRRKDKTDPTPLPGDHPDEPHYTQWDGLSYFDGASMVYDPATGELGSHVAYPAFPPGTFGLREAAPETVILIQRTLAPTGAGRFLACSNYCGKHSAGKLLLLDVSGSVIDTNARVIVDLYWLLGRYVDLGVGDDPASVGALGPEVASTRFTMPTGAPNYDVNGNKIRGLHVVRVNPTAQRNAGRILLLVTINLDPVDVMVAGEPALDTNGSGTNLGLDDGKYDYIAIVDITDMRRTATEPFPPDGSWYFGNPAEWQNRVKFIRLPADVPGGWTPAQGPPPAGYDWSFVDVPYPAGTPPAGEPAVKPQRIVASGTPSTITSDPSGRYAYVVSVDQGIGGLNSPTPDLTQADGGWNVPHLYVIDLTAFDLTGPQPQYEIDQYVNGIAMWRFNKHVYAIWPDNVWGANNVAATIIGYPGTGPTVLPPGSPASVIGPEYGEYQLDPHPTVRASTVRNLSFASRKDRLYVGLVGKWQASSSNAYGWVPIGSVVSLHLDNPGVPQYHRTLTIPQVLAPLPGDVIHPYQVRGLIHIPPSLAGGAADRNLLAVTSLDSQPLIPAVNRMTILQDGP